MMKKTKSQLLRSALVYVALLYPMMGFAQAPIPTVISPLSGPITNAEPFGDGALVDFLWTDNGTRLEDFAIYVGTSKGSADIARVTHLSTRYIEETPDTQIIGLGIPANGQPFYLRFFWRYDDEWKFQDFDYVAPNF